MIFALAILAVATDPSVIVSAASVAVWLRLEHRLTRIETKIEDAEKQKEK